MLGDTSGHTTGLKKGPSPLTARWCLKIAARSDRLKTLLFLIAETMPLVSNMPTLLQLTSCRVMYDTKHALCYCWRCFPGSAVHAGNKTSGSSMENHLKSVDPWSECLDLSNGGRFTPPLPPSAGPLRWAPSLGFGVLGAKHRSPTTFPAEACKNLVPQAQVPPGVNL